MNRPYQAVTRTLRGVRVVKTPAPLRFYLGSLAFIAGGLLAAAKQWTAAIALFAIGVAWYYVGLAWFARRVRRIRKDEALTSRDIVEIDYPQSMRRLVKGYVALLAGTVGLGILGAVVFLIIAVARKV